MNRVTFLWHVSVSQLAVGWLVGCRNLDGAIRVLEKLQSCLPDCAQARAVRKGLIAMMAQCHRGAQRNDDALAAAKQVHALDCRHLKTDKSLSEIYAERGEHEVAVKHARRRWRVFHW